MRKLIGIDEAGRGPVLGPLVMAVVAIPEDRVEELESFNIRDSKKYGSGKKAKMERITVLSKIKACCDWHVLEIPPNRIDAYVAQKRLDDLEREGALDLLDTIGATKQDEIICDGQPIFGRLTAQWPNLIAENKADGKYLSVSAASIIAKTHRDMVMDQIIHKYESEYGPITGGGYVNKGSREFLAAYEAKNGTLPVEARKSWTWRPKPKYAESPNILDLLSQ